MSTEMQFAESNIMKGFPITNEEYFELDKKFGSLAEYQAWQLLKKNSRNQMVDDQQDVSQEIKFHLIKAASYYKRQVYIEKNLKTAKKYVKDEFMLLILKNLLKLWKRRKKHGANRQKFGPLQEYLLDKITEHSVPVETKPSRSAPLVIDNDFITYCKSITWNAQKYMGKKISKERTIRAGMVSISEYDYLGGV